MLRLRHFVLLPLMLFLVGCIRVGDFSRHAMRYNEAVEEAQNKMLLLNIVRADRHRPMYLTDLSTITGNVKLDFSTGGIETDYGLHGARTLASGKLAPSLEYAHSPSFNVNVLSTQEFMNGFLKPTSNELVKYYWDQRWEQELLLYLFVHKVSVRSVKDKTAPEEIYENYPINEDGELKRVEEFGHWVTGFLQRKPTFVKKEANIGPCPEAGKISNLADLVKVAKEGLTLTEVEPGQYRLRQPKPDLSLMSEKEAALAKESEAVCNHAPGKSQSEPKLAADKAQAEQGGQMSFTSEGKETTLFLRSPEGILYYLGELMRVEEDGLIPEICIEGELVPLFVAFEKTGPGHGPAPNCPSTVAVQYDGSEFIVPYRRPDPPPAETADMFQCPKSIGEAGYEVDEGKRKYLKGLDRLQCSPGRSMQALSLLTQLIALQKSAKDIPATTVIRAIQ